MTTRAAAYEIQVQGHLDELWTGWIGGAQADRNDDGTTTLVLVPEDQAALHGVLTGLRDIGVTLLSLRLVQSFDNRTPAEGRTPPRTPGSESHVSTSAVLRGVLTTERLTLRPCTADDADSTWRYRRLPEVNEWITGTPATFEEYQAHFTEQERLATTVIVELQSAARAVVVGDFMLKREDSWAQREVQDQARDQQVELGWVLDPAHTGHGYAAEAVAELVRYCFDELKVRRIVVGCFLDNERSWRLMERLGMRRESHSIRDALHRRGEWLDSLTYALLADEWRGLQER